VNTSPKFSNVSVNDATAADAIDSDRPSAAIAQSNLPEPPTDPERSEPSTPTIDPGAVAVLGSTFFTIFLAEVGDKTQLAVLLMTAESEKPWVVFAGSACALIATSLLGVMLGRWLSTRVSPKTLERSAAVVLLFISATLLWDVLH
jgi:putative Ca2+/H+ antiporter (TMEM165/GDT1 family)